MKTEITREDFLQFNKHVYFGKKLRKSVLIAAGFLVLLVTIMNIGESFDLLAFVIEIVILLVIWSLIFVIIHQINFPCIPFGNKIGFFFSENLAVGSCVEAKM